MAINGTIIASRVRSTLLDADGAFWSDSDIQDALNAALRAIVLHRPAAYARTQVVTLAARAEQAIPDDAEMLLDVRSNVAPSSSPPKELSRIRQIDRRQLDETRPGWMAETGPAVKRFMYDPRTPRVFLVWPTPTSTAQVMGSFSYTPPPLLDLEQAIPLSTLYEPAIHDFICATLLTRNTTEGSMPRANAFMTSFATLIGWRSRATASSATPAEPEG